MINLGVEEKAKKKTITLKVTIPTKETIVEALTKLFPGIEVEVEEKTSEEATTKA